MNSWTLADWAARVIGLYLFIHGAHFVFSQRIKTRNKYTGERSIVDDSNPGRRNIYRIVGLAGLILGPLMIIFGRDIKGLLSW